MRQYLPNIAVFVVLAATLTTGWWYVDKTFFPKPPPPVVEPPKPPRETILALAGAAVSPTKPAEGWPLASPRIDPKPDTPKPPPTPPVPPKPLDPPTLIALGDDASFKRVLLTSRGGAVQQVILRAFDEASRLGLEVKQSDGTPQPLRLIPGVVHPPRTEVSLTDIRRNPSRDDVPELRPGQVPDAVIPKLADASYVLLHYPTTGDPHRDPIDPAKPGEFDERPSRELGDREWAIVGTPGRGPDGVWTAVFETTLDAPYHLRLRKTYTLDPKAYHIGLKLDVEPLPGRVQKQGRFKYQIAGPRGIPIEGEWYTAMYRNALVGSVTPGGGAKRSFDDAISIHRKHGADAVKPDGNTFAYAAVVTQYFASALAVDSNQSATLRQTLWEYVRPTREPVRGDDPDRPQLSDITVRAVATPLDPGPSGSVSHSYLIYNGPIKVRLLRQLRGDLEVNDELVYHYLDDLTLRTLTDYHSPNVFGQFSNAIWWTDLIVAFTNMMHAVLGFLHHRVGLPWGLAIVALTVTVRLILMIPSRKQQIMMMRMQEKMTVLKPELDKIQAKYKDDPHALQQEKAKLMFKHGVNPLSTMGGCLLMFAQMPVFMGLYFCLQESVFFRLSQFLWAPNLAAPDMLVWWSEAIPVISDPSNTGPTDNIFLGLFRMLYLGPYFNVLPLLAVALIFVQQLVTMPPPTDEQQAATQRMMKYTVLAMGVFFYKVPAGLCLYFICSTAWALTERTLIPKPKTGTTPLPPEGSAGSGATASTPTNGTTNGGFLARMRARLDEMQRQADEQTRRQIRNDDRPGSGGDKKKRKR